MPSSSDETRDTNKTEPLYYYFIYIQSKESLSIIYKYDIAKRQLLPLSENLMGDNSIPPSHMTMGKMETGLILNILKKEDLISSDPSTWIFPNIVKVDDQDLFRYFLPNKRPRVIPLPKASSLLTHISVDPPSFAPPSTPLPPASLLEYLKSFKIGLGSVFLTFEEARLCILIYSQLILKRPLKILHSEIKRESYTVACHKSDCLFSISVRVCKFVKRYPYVFPT